MSPDAPAVDDPIPADIAVLAEMLLALPNNATIGELLVNCRHRGHAVTLVRLLDQDRPGLELCARRPVPAEALAGDTLLVAMLASARGTLRQSEFGDGPRAGFCLMGACQDCWVWTAAGRPLRACTTPVAGGDARGRPHGARGMAEPASPRSRRRRPGRRARRRDAGRGRPAADRDRRGPRAAARSTAASRPISRRSHETLYGGDAGKARALHEAFDALRPRFDYRPETLAWNMPRRSCCTSCATALPRPCGFDALILCTGATDRLVPINGWTLPGCYSLGGAQIALKAQACSIGRRVVFLRHRAAAATWSPCNISRPGPTSRRCSIPRPSRAKLAARCPISPRGPALLRGLRLRRALTRAGVPVVNGVVPLAYRGRCRGAPALPLPRRGARRRRRVACDAVALGFHLQAPSATRRPRRPAPSASTATQQWLPRGGPRRPPSPAPASISRATARAFCGADAAELAGRRPALAAARRCRPRPSMPRASLRWRARRRFRAALARAFPWPAALAATDGRRRHRLPLRGDHRRPFARTATPRARRSSTAPRRYARVGMGRCQGRYCGNAAAEILAEARGCRSPRPAGCAGRRR